MTESGRRDAAYYREQLKLEPHVEGGYFREYLRGEQETAPGRKAYSSIFFLLCENEVSHLHRLSYDEVWYFHDGNPLTIYMLTPEGELRTKKLGREIGKGEMPQIAVPAGVWFGAAMETPGFSLVGCMCAPAFRYEDFELMSAEQLESLYPRYRERLAKLIR